MSDPDVYVVPWVLPNEKIPVHVTWDEIQFDEIRISYNNRLDISDLYNVKKYSLSENHLIIEELRQDGYVGINFQHKEIPDEIIVKEKIDVKFIKNSEYIFEKDVWATIVRPKLEFIHYPNKLELTDENVKDLQSLVKLKLKHSGSGNIIFQVNVFTGGKVISTHENFFKIILEKVLKDENFEEEEKELIDEEYIMKGMKEISEYIENAEESQEVALGLQNSLLETMKKYKEDDVKKKIQAAIQNALMEIFSDINEMYPSDHSTKKGGKTNALIEGTLDKVEVQIKYKDSTQNDYDPIHIKIDVDDKRENPVPIQVPINVNIVPDFIKNLNEESS